MSIALAEQVAGASGPAAEVLDEHLEKLAADNLGAVWRITEERAGREARPSTAQSPRAAIPTARARAGGMEDLTDTGGITTTYGSALFRDHVPERDADVVARFAAAGAVCVAKLATHEFAWGTTNQNPHFGSCKNPHDPTRVPGGIEPAAPAPRSRRDWSALHPAPTRAGRSAVPPRAAGSWA